MEKKIQVKKQKKFRETFWNKFRKNPLFYLFLLFFLIKGSYETYNNYRLERDGIYTTAVIYKNGKRCYMHYKFQVDGVAYYGKEWTSKTIGDTVSIVYLPSNPKINRSNKMIEKVCDK